MAGAARRYRFGPLERRGLVGSLRPLQVFVLAAAMTTGVVLMRLLPTGVGVLAAGALVVASLGFCFWPIAGRPAESWLPVVGGFTLRHARGRHRHFSAAPQAGVTARPNARPQPVVSLPAAAEGLEVL